MGDVYIDAIGDRIADYSLLDMTDLQDGVYHVSNIQQSFSTVSCFFTMTF